MPDRRLVGWSLRRLHFFLFPTKSFFPSGSVMGCAKRLICVLYTFKHCSKALGTPNGASRSPIWSRFPYWVRSYQMQITDKSRTCVCSDNSEEPDLVCTRWHIGCINT